MPLSPRSFFVGAFALVLGGCASAGAPLPSVPLGGAASEAEGLPEAIEGTHYQVYRGDGTEASLAELTREAGGVDVLFMGEEHDDPLGHRLQLDLLWLLHARYTMTGERSVVLSMEMFERDVQPVLDEYLEDLITEEHFEASARPWETYGSFYRPLVEWAKTREVPVLAANAPRRYVNRASRLGRESLADLPDGARRWLAPLPYPKPSDAYQAQLDEVMGEATQHGGGALMDGQMLWDATMGVALSEALTEWPDALVVHLVGGFHVERGTGIPETLEHYRPDARSLVVAVRSVADVDAFELEEHRGLGDYVVLTDESLKEAHPGS